MRKQLHRFDSSHWTWVGLVAASMACVTSAFASGTTYYLVTDVPALLAGTNYMPNQIIRSDVGVYSLQTSVPGSTGIGGLHRREDGVWLLSPSFPARWGENDYEPRDVVLYDVLSFTLLFDGSTAGIPDYARIDALLIDPATSNLVLSFDVPVNIGGTEYSQSDLVRYDGGVLYSLYWDAEGAGIPADSNLVGADVDGAGTLVISFDVPTNLGGIQFLPGQLVQWNNPGFSSYFLDPGWSPFAQLRDFSFVPSAFLPNAPSGRTPGDGCVPVGVPLTVVRNLGTGDLTLSWASSCLATDTDYEVYEGTMGPSTTVGFYSHFPKVCTTAGAIVESFAPGAGSTYYIVVPRNDTREGSYGLDSRCIERPRGTPACELQEIGVCP